jgi:integrase
MQTWTPEQVQTFLARAEGDRLYALYVLALSTGLRQSELFGLRWSDVDLDHAEFTVSVAVQRSRLRGVRLEAEPKTANVRRTLAPTTTAGVSVVDVLRARHKRQAEERLAAGPAWQGNNLVCCNTIGGPLEHTNVERRCFAPLAKRAGLPLIRFHDLHHTAATNLLAAGVKVEVVSQMLGHSDVATILRFYCHVRRDELHAAAEVMGRLLGGSEDRFRGVFGPTRVKRPTAEERSTCKVA